MKIVINKEFFKSLFKRHSRWNHIYVFFRYDIWRFLKNIKRFRRELWSFQPWDYQYNLMLLQRSLELTLKSIENGNEISQTRLKKVEKIQRAIEILNHINKDMYLDMAEEQLGKKIDSTDFFERLEKIPGEDAYRFNEKSSEAAASDKEIFDFARKIEKEEWNELWQIFKGQRDEDFRPSESNDWEKTENEYREWFDGSGMKHWWD